MKIEWNYGTEVLTLPKGVLTAAFSASEGDLKVLLALASLKEEEKSDFDPASLSSKLNMSEQEIELSIAFWRGTTFLKTGRSVKKEKKKESPSKMMLQDSLPHYMGKELKEILETRTTLNQLLNECQKIVGKVFNLTESNKMIALSDYLHLDDDFILLLASYCESKGKGTVAYISKMAYELYNQDIVTSLQLEEYIEKSEKRNDFQNKLRKLFGIGGRALTNKEKKFFENFEKMGFSLEVLKIAYEISVNATGELAYPHLNAVLEGFKSAGVETAEDAEKYRKSKKEEFEKTYEVKKPGSKKEKSTDFESFDAEDFFKAAEKKSLDQIIG